jgi:hypothetical protein
MKKLVLIVLFLAAVSLGCKLSSLLPGSSGGSSSGPGGSSGSGADPKADVIEASRKFIALPSFSAKMDGTNLQSQVDYAAPDKYHVTYISGTGAGMELIMIGNQSFMKTGGKWSKMPGDGNSSIPTLRDSFTEEGLKTLDEVKYEGEDTANGKPSRVYTYKNVTPKGAFPFGAKIWITKDKGLPVKIVADYPTGPLKQMTVNYDTETPVTIEPPIN